jgi:ATP-binding cassette subfamily F protein 3
MTLLQVNHLAKSYDQGLSYIFTDVDFTVDEGKHIALVGANGSGKSTLLKIIAALEDHEGMIQRKRGLRIGYQVQEPSFKPEVTVKAVLDQCFREVRDLQERLGVLEARMGSAQKEDLANVLEEYGGLQERFEILGGYTYEQEMLRVVRGLGLKESDLNRSAQSLSGGEKSKLLLACQLLEKPDLLLLDEPTNHLDVESLEWLEGFLQEYVGTLLIVSHDRYFLDQVAGEVWELERERMNQYFGNYSQYIEEKERRQKNQWAEYEKQQREIASLHQQMQEQRVNAGKAEKDARAGADDGDKSFWARKAAKVAKKVKVAQAKREKLLTTKRLEKPFEENEVKIQFPVETRTSGTILHVKELAMAYEPDQPLFQDISFDLGSRNRVGVVGANGAGKTTLFRLILGQVQPITGEIVTSGRVKISYYSQEQENLNDAQSALENILTNCRVDETTARSILGCVKMEKEKVHVPVRHLSGGEKSKVQLCKILLSGANLLILDEPTNHLDISCREAVETALLQYPGAILFISHDRYFLQKLADVIVYIDGERTRVHHGDYASFRSRIHNAASIASPEVLVWETRHAALLGQLSLLKEHQEEEKVRLSAEIFYLEQQMSVSFFEEGLH